ncbi:DUF2314 domain-containing protein [Taibaiella koreensis]|uniref:DUF2314 domain-containing protein n=1 Tax=Taibaiella koreensis TaxID=1268548 RepID=UPI000E5A0AD0|nr:DUF2314 domain-containing protein [Taibaiella koreensis]
MDKPIIFFAKGDSPEMIAAFEQAQDTFKYFWRELSWEYRRIVPGLDLACVKVAFSQQVEDKAEPAVEHMWINEIDYDGETISGILLNDPNELTNVEKGEAVAVPLEQVSDWLFASQGKTYGGFTIQAMRSGMDKVARKEHDAAWGLDFGDYNDISIVYQQKEKPENLVEHPMSRNMGNSLADFLKQHPGELNATDEAGYSMLHRETIAGNLTSVEILLSHGADRNIRTHSGKTAFDFARQLNWQHIIPVLE